MLTSIQSDLSDEQALQLQTDILKLFADGNADGLVIDITSVDVIDSYMARVLNETAKMVGIMGGEAVLTGMPPTVAVTLVEMGRNIVGVETALNLEAGVEKLKALLARQHVSGGMLGERSR